MKAEPSMRISNEIHLSAIRKEDASALVMHLQDSVIFNNTLRIPFPYSESDAHQWIQHCEESRMEPEVSFAIRNPQDELVGFIGPSDGLPTKDAHKVEIGYWMAGEYRGQGIMPAVLRVYVKHLFEKVGLDRVQAIPFFNNLSSQKALEKAGFHREGMLRRYFCKGGKYLDGIMYSMLKEEYAVAAQLTYLNGGK